VTLKGSRLGYNSDLIKISLLLIAS